jgi:xylose isomerase
LKTLAHLGKDSIDGVASPLRYNERTASALKGHAFDMDALRRQGYQYERLDQLTTEVLLGVR